MRLPYPYPESTNPTEQYPWKITTGGMSNTTTVHTTSVKTQVLTESTTQKGQQGGCPHAYIPFQQLQVRVAHPSAQHADQGLSWLGHRNSHVFLDDPDRLSLAGVVQAVLDHERTHSDAKACAFVCSESVVSPSSVASSSGVNSSNDNASSRVCSCFLSNAVTSESGSTQRADVCMFKMFHTRLFRTYMRRNRKIEVKIQMFQVDVDLRPCLSCLMVRHTPPYPLPPRQGVLRGMPKQACNEWGGYFWRV